MQKREGELLLFSRKCIYNTAITQSWGFFLIDVTRNRFSDIFTIIKKQNISRCLLVYGMFFVRNILDFSEISTIFAISFSYLALSNFCCIAAFSQEIKKFVIKWNLSLYSLRYKCAYGENYSFLPLIVYCVYY